jgi:hypothetical protein
MAEAVRVNAPDLTLTSAKVGQLLETAAKPLSTAVPPPAAASPVDVAAANAAGAMHTKMTAMSTEMAAKGPAIQQAGAAAAASLLTQDATNAARMPSIPSGSAPTSGISAIAATAGGASRAAAAAAPTTSRSVAPAGTTGAAAKPTIRSTPFKQDNPGGVTLPTNPYPPGTIKHDEVEETDRKLLEYGTKLAAYNLKDPPTNEAEYEERYHEYLELNADLADIVLSYKQEGIEIVVDSPSAPAPPG